MGRLVVVGSSNTDLVIQAPRVPSPGETVLGGTFTSAAGGKGANQAVAAARAGADVSLVACVGDDAFGESALKGLVDAGLDARFCAVVEGQASGVAQIVVGSDGENSIVVAPGANARLTPGHVEQAREVIAGASWMLLQLEIPIETVVAAAKLAREVGTRVLLDPAPAAELPSELYPLVTVATPNETEAQQLTGIAVCDEPSAAAAAAVLHARGVESVVITRGAAGAYYSRDSGDDARTFPGFSAEVIDTTAAGDVFNGNLAAAFSAGMSFEAAINAAQAAAALSVQMLGAQPSAPHERQVQDFLNSANGE